MQNVTFENEDYSTKIEVIRTKRKTISLQVSPEAKIILRAPIYAKDKDIQNLIKKHTAWILKQQKKRQDYKAKSFANGEKFLYLGQKYKLIIIQENLLNLYNKPLKKLNFDNTFFLSSSLVKNAKNLFINWYKEQAKTIITKRVDLYSKQMKLKYSSIKINSAKHRWASCSIKRNLNFSYRLIMAPLEVIDYVVVHELTHIKEMNHQKVFWDKVASIIPNYKIHKKWLKDNGYILDL